MHKFHRAITDGSRADSPAAAIGVYRVGRDRDPRAPPEAQPRAPRRARSGGRRRAGGCDAGHHLILHARRCSGPGRPRPAWRRTGPGLAADGKPRFDLEQLEPEYLRRLEARVDLAGRRGIYMSVMLFEGYGVQFQKEAWANHPFNPANNVNGIDGDRDGDGKGIEMHQLGRIARSMALLQRSSG